MRRIAPGARFLITATVVSAVLAVLSAPASGRLLQAQTVTASGQVQRWNSQRFGEHALVFVKIYVGGRELNQASGKCSGTYSGAGVAVHVLLENCGRAGRGRYIFRYVSFTGTRSVRIRLIT